MTFAGNWLQVHSSSVSNNSLFCASLQRIEAQNAHP